MIWLPCKQLGCTQCCQWGDDAETLKPDPTLLADESGNCLHLIPAKGCALWGTDKYPEACKQFDCRELFKSMSNSPFTRILIAAIRLQAYTAGGAVTVKKGEQQ